MKKEKQKSVFAAACLLLTFAVWTVLVTLIDRQAIGPRGSVVGFATLNRWVHGLTGVHLSLYIVTDWLGLVPVAVAAGFGILGLIQWIKGKSFLKVDRSLLVLGGFYLAVMVVYLLFEGVVINYRPVLIDGVLEVSYPSSTTLLVMCVMPTAMMQLSARIKPVGLRRTVVLVMAVFTVFMVVGRLISGVHWVTDIIGGGLLSAGLVTMYHGCTR